MRTIVVVMCLLALVLGCGKKKKAAATAPSATEPAKDGSAATDMPAPVNAEPVPAPMPGEEGGEGNRGVTGGAPMGSGSADPMVRAPADDGGELKKPEAKKRRATMPADDGGEVKKPAPADDGGE